MFAADRETYQAQTTHMSMESHVAKRARSICPLHSFKLHQLWECVGFMCTVFCEMLEQELKCVSNIEHICISCSSDSL